MLEPEGTPQDLLRHHRRHAALAHDSGDSKAAYWHGVQAQAVARKIPDDQPNKIRHIHETITVRMDPIEAYDNALVIA